MSILDGLPKSEAEWQQVMKIGQPLLGYMEASTVMTPQQKKNWQHVKEGIPLSDLLGITKQEREAGLAQGCRLIKQKQMKEARAILLQLYTIYPYDARVPYAIAISFQLEGDISAAAKLFVQATALDATNPDGYLRLGECFLAAREYENAAGSFEGARDLCERGYGSPKTQQYATRMLEHVMARIDALEAKSTD